MPSARAEGTADREDYCAAQTFVLLRGRFDPRWLRPHMIGNTLDAADPFQAIGIPPWFSGALPAPGFGARAVSAVPICSDFPMDRAGARLD